MIFVAAPRHSQCVFNSCGHAEAKHIAVHEFVRYSNKPVCPRHKTAIERMLMRLHERAKDNDS